MQTELDKLRFFAKPKLGLDAVGGASALRMTEALAEVRTCLACTLAVYDICTQQLEICCMHGQMTAGKLNSVHDRCTGKGLVSCACMRVSINPSICMSPVQLVPWLAPCWVVRAECIYICKPCASMEVLSMMSSA